MEFNQLQPSTEITRENFLTDFSQFKTYWMDISGEAATMPSNDIFLAYDDWPSAIDKMARRIPGNCTLGITICYALMTDGLQSLLVRLLMSSILSDRLIVAILDLLYHFLSQPWDLFRVGDEEQRQYELAMRDLVGPILVQLQSKHAVLSYPEKVLRFYLLEASTLSSPIVATLCAAGWGTLVLAILRCEMIRGNEALVLTACEAIYRLLRDCGEDGRAVLIGEGAVDVLEQACQMNTQQTRRDVSAARYAAEALLILRGSIEGCFADFSGKFSE
jgi:hypothetical protein